MLRPYNLYTKEMVYFAIMKNNRVISSSSTRFFIYLYRAGNYDEFASENTKIIYKNI